MVGRDINSFPKQYRTWVTADEPDLDGYYYTGLKSGTDPLQDISAYAIQDDGYVVDFNLPLPLEWESIKGTMPAAATSSQFAIIDGYAYLFGGERSNKIWRASLNNPAYWEDTGATLPTTLSRSQFAIVDDEIFLFGGKGGPNEQAVKTIFSADISDPLTWNDWGSYLPEELHSSHLAIIGDYIYLFGGQGKNSARDYIWRAPVIDPYTWEDTGYVLPVAMYGGAIAIAANQVFLYGGCVNSNSPLDTIYSAALTDPFTWSGWDSVLPASCCFGQFLSIGYQGYLFTQAVVDESVNTYQTRIFRCELEDPATWVDTGVTIPGDLHQSQFGIIYDRIFAFGGNGISAIYCCKQLIKYKLINQKFKDYGEVTRTQYDGITSPTEKTYLLGFPYWKTDYDQ